ncbi:MAG: cytochrome c biogenesis protein CcsA [Pseudomonadota bacterium]
MASILLHSPAPHFLAVSLYAGLALHLWRTRWRGALLDQPVKGLVPWERIVLLAALLLHGLSIGEAVFPPVADGTRIISFSFAVALSVIMWQAVALYWIESFYARMEGLLVLGLPLAAICVVMPLGFPGQHLLANAGSLTFHVHFLVAMLAYSLFTLAALHAILMAVTEQRLHRGRLTPFFAGLPPLLTMETLLFRLINVAFVLLTLTLLSGVIFSEHLFGKALTLSHKTVFAVLSWLIFAALLFGRHRYGWRGRTALRWTLTGFGVLLLAYVGSRFVLEVLLGRP